MPEFRACCASFFLLMELMIFDGMERSIHLYRQKIFRRGHPHILFEAF